MECRMGRGVRTWRSGDVSCCEEGVDGWRAGEEDGEDARGEGACLGSCCTFVLVEGLDEGAFL